MNRHWAALIALSLDALSSDKKMEFDLSQGGAFHKKLEFDLSQGGAFPAIDS